LIVARRSPSNRVAVGAGVFGASGFRQAPTAETPIRAVPAFVFQLPRSQVALFLNRLFSGRGWASLSPSLPGRVGFIAGSQVIARQTSHLLSRFGIISTVRPHLPGRVPRDRGEYSVVISERASVLRFAEEIGIFGLEHAMDELVAALAEKAPTNHPFPHQPKAGQVYWDEIVAIEPLGRKQVYDLTIPGTHNFIANDICVHNTSLALNFAEAAAMPRKGDGVGVLLFSLEMSASQLALRMLCSRARVNMKLLRDGLLSKNGDEQNRLLECADEFSKAPLFIDDSSSLSIMQLRAKARRLHARHKLGFIIVDYLQLLAPTDGKMPREQQVAEASRGLKALSKELDLPVLVLSQLNRASEKENRTPKLADLRESGSIEQDADIVLMLARPKDADEKFQVAADSAELIVAKQRNGPVGDLKLTFLRDITRFENYTQ
jgi:replicative DNA helicase